MNAQLRGFKYLYTCSMYVLVMLSPCRRGLVLNNSSIRLLTWRRAVQPASPQEKRGCYWVNLNARIINVRIEPIITFYF
jgi:hypothetical protein